ncbi:MAG: hypothetical protein HWE14_03255 [Flavobacteriia bacterium]|nr:hypothetical protein [Flavobacteriia bacterium]
MEHQGDYIEFVRDATAGRFNFTANLVLLVALGLVALPYLSEDLPISQTKLQTIAGAAGLIGLLIKTTRTKVQFDIRGRRMRTHNHILGLRLGRWRKIEPLTDICLITKKYQFSNQRGMNDGNSSKVYELFLFSKDKRKKYYLMWTPNKEVAEKVMKELQRYFRFEETTYTPKRVPITRR